MIVHDSRALEALDRSRERLRVALREVHAAQVSEAVRSDSGRAGADAQSTGSTGAEPLIDRLLGWWWPHPLRLACGVLARSTHAAVQPVAQKHPVALVLGAAAVGGLLVTSRPWRLLITPALLAGLLPRLLANATAQLPRGSWLALLTAVAPTLFATNGPPDRARATAPPARF